ncbi:MAG TPA: hypothetical protein PLG59_05830, partial [bacterium]|nr:hypothetical protein [bacterium]
SFPEGYFAPVYNPNIPGSLIDSNLEPGDFLVVAAEVSRVTPGLVATILSATPEERLSPVAAGVGPLADR